MMQSKPVVHLITFGGGSPKLRAAAHRLGRQASRSGFFATITVFTDLELPKDKPFYAEHGAFIERNARGYGYWIWKPYLLLRMLEKVNDGEGVIFCDAGCEFNPLGRQILSQYARAIARTGLLLFRLPYLNERWTKGDLLERYPALIGQGQLTSAIVGVRADDAGRAFTRSWYDMCRSNGYQLISDTPSVAPSHPDFVEHRHDQTCLSALALAVPGATILPADPEFVKGRRMIDYPILIRRNRTGHARLFTRDLPGFSIFIYFKRRFSPRVFLRPSAWKQLIPKRAE